MDLVTLTRRRQLFAVFGALLVCGVLACPAVDAQDTLSATAERSAADDALELVTTALVSGDYNAVLDLARGRVEIMILGQGARYSHSQAAMVLRNFFRQYPPERVELSEHSARGDDRTAMGQYWAQSGESPLSLYVGYRVMDNDGWQLGSIHIERGSFRRSEDG